MSKVIAVSGSPNSGKTTVGLKLAQSIYGGQKKTVLFFSPTLTVPTLGYIFPHCKESDLYSIGQVLDKTSVYREDVLKRIVTVKTMMNFGFLGFKAAENKYSYPRPTEDKVQELFACMREIAEYIVIDCSSDRSDLISTMAKAEADCIVQLITPDLKCMTYYASNGDQFEAFKERIVKVMNITEKDVYLPIDEVCNHFKVVKHILPYSRALKQQAITGTLSERIADGKFKNKINGVAKAVI